MSTETILKKGKNSFSLTGKVKRNDYTFTLRKKSESSDYIYSRINLAVDCGDGNIVYAEMMDGCNPNDGKIIYTRVDKTFESLEVDWEKRKDSSIISKVSDMSLIRVGIKFDTKGGLFVEKFLSPFDAIDYLDETLEDGTYVTVSGELEYSVYNGETQMKKKIKSIFLTKEDEAHPPKANFIQTFLFEKNYLGQADAETNTLRANAFVPEYINKADGITIKKTVLIPKAFDFDLSKFDEAKLRKALPNYFKFKNGYWFEMTIEGTFREGVAIKGLDEVDDSLLDEVSSAMKNDFDLDDEDFKSRKVIAGQRDKRMFFKKPYQQEKTTELADGSKVVDRPIMSCADKYMIGEIPMYFDFVDGEFDDANPSVISATPKVDKKAQAEIVDDEDDFINSLLK